MQTGFARTGKLFALEHYGVEPDLITIAKSIAGGFPLSGVLGKAEILDAAHDGAVGGTFVGNPVAQAAALAVLDVIDEEGLCERAVAIGETMRARMLAWQERFPPIGDVRGLGAMLAIELVADRATKKPAPELAQAVIDAAMHRGLLLLKAGVHGNVIRVLSPARAHRRRARRGARGLGRRARARARRSPFSAAGMALSVRQLIADRYELGEVVGSGGMSSVYRAFDTLLERNVALKILHPQYGGDDDYVERFRREARAVAQLSHPNIVTVIDRGEEAGREYIVFELVDGDEPEGARRAERAAARAAGARARARGRPRARVRARRRGSCTGT